MKLQNGQHGRYIVAATSWPLRRGRYIVAATSSPVPIEVLLSLTWELVNGKNTNPLFFLLLEETEQELWGERGDRKW